MRHDKPKKLRKSNKSEHRNCVERQRQTAIDDLIQQLMTFLPTRPDGVVQRMSRNQILAELCEVAQEIVDREKKNQG
uniref:BHLH domain-containing protein n=1 Tax=Caenorhabditis japonica TaxID=281687 RepID=A0A8R1EN45_CAEJA